MNISFHDKKIVIKVIPGAKKTLIKQENDQMKVYLNAPPVDGKANDLLIEVLAEYWHIPKSKIEIIKGLKSRNKILMICDH